MVEPGQNKQTLEVLKLRNPFPDMQQGQLEIVKAEWLYLQDCRELVVLCKVKSNQQEATEKYVFNKEFVEKGDPLAAK